MKSRQAVLVEAGRFEVDDVVVEPGAGEVLVKMEAVCVHGSSITGPDVLARRLFLWGTRATAPWPRSVRA